MCFPGSEIPDWFNIQSRRSSIKLPRGSFNHKKFLGFVFCVIVEVKDFDCLDKCFLNVKYELRVKCLDEYMTFDKKLLSVGRTNIKSDHVLLGYNCNTCEIYEFSGDTEAIIIFEPENIMENGVKNKKKHGVKKIKKSGVRLLFSQEFEEPMKGLRCSIFDEEEKQEEAYSISKGNKFSNFSKGKSSSSSGLHLVQHEKEVEEFEEPMKRLRCSIFDEEEEQEEAYSVSKEIKFSNFFKGESSSSAGLHLVQHGKEVEEFEEPMKRLRCSYSVSKENKFSNFFKGESSSSSGLHLVLHEKEVEELNPSINDFNPSANEPGSFTTYDLNEFPQDLVGSTKDVIATNMLSPADNDGAKPKGSWSHPATNLDIRTPNFSSSLGCQASKFVRNLDAQHRSNSYVMEPPEWSHFNIRRPQ
ncbi:hypothetical protein Patl1_07757 [Pistacia atlantica]|uniref:Uncharacterized protein n=1 Tax=Pistacia atlantica TaxID=434234 RepID=A0ACC1AKR7_9ROSI|nr:hypothetical protein Patl1_07757 [Pistacia atlantica]